MRSCVNCLILRHSRRLSKHEIGSCFNAVCRCAQGVSLVYVTSPRLKSRPPEISGTAKKLAVKAFLAPSRVRLARCRWLAIGVRDVSAATGVVAQPAKGSNTMSLGFELALMNRS